MGKHKTHQRMILINFCFLIIETFIILWIRVNMYDLLQSTELPERPTVNHTGEEA